MYHQEKTAGGGDVGQMEMRGQQDATQHPSHEHAYYSDRNQYSSQVYQQQPPYDAARYEQKPQPAVYAVAAQPPPSYGGAYPQQTSDQY